MFVSATNEQILQNYISQVCRLVRHEGKWEKVGGNCFCNFKK